MKGYMGKILRVDLTEGKVRHESLPSEDILRKYIGGYGLGLKFVYDECPPGTDALDPRCPLAFFTGPLTGSRMPAPTNLTCVTKNFDTGFTVGRSHTHGWFGILLKAAGYDGIIVTGKAENPVYLWVHDGKAEIRDAEKLWGKFTHETEDLVKEEVGQPKASVAAIGPGGENLCAGAMICNDKNHSMSHSGVGVVMGAKRLKAIAVWGDKKLEVADLEKEKKLAKQWIKGLDWDPIASYNIVGQGRIGRDSTEYSKIIAAGMGSLCAYNLKSGELPGFLEDTKHKSTVRPCPRCPVACCYDLEIGYGPHKGYVATLSGGGEAIEGSSAMVGVIESANAFYLTDLYDQLGLEGSTVGCAISMAFEAFEKGLITTEDTDGLVLRWGDADVVEKIVRKYAYREGFGDILAKGPRDAAEFIGGDAPNFAVHVKGTGMSLHDWRHQWGQFLGQIVGSGAGWTTPGIDYRMDADAGFPEKAPGQTCKDKALQISRTGIHKHINDSTGMCWFVTWARPSGISLSADAISALTGWDYTKEELLEVGQRIAQLEHAFNVRHGLVPEDEYSVSKRLLEPPDCGPGKGKTLAPYLRGMVEEYYRHMGWDVKTGKPWKRTLERVGLDAVAKDLWG